MVKSIPIGGAHLIEGNLFYQFLQALQSTETWARRKAALFDAVRSHHCDTSQLEETRSEKLLCAAEK